jgi:hypothetical protein
MTEIRGLNENENAKFHYDGITSVRVVGREVAPTDSLRLNGSLVLTYTGTNLTKIEKVVGGVTYTKTLTYNGSNQLTDVSVWS